MNLNPTKEKSMSNKSWAEQIIENQKKLDALSQIADALRQEIEAEKEKQPMRYKGSVATVSALPASGNEIGDMRNVEETGNNYAWDGEKWEAMSGVLSLPVATTTNAGISKLGNGTVITNGGGVGMNASGQLIIAQGTMSAYGVFKLGNGTVVTTGAGIGVNTSGQLFVAQGSINTPGVFKLATSTTIPNNGGLVGITQGGQLACRIGTDMQCGAVWVKSSNNTAAGYNSSSATAPLGDNCGMSVFAGQNSSNLSGGFYVGYSSSHTPSWTESLTRYQHDRIRVYGSTNGVYEDYFLRQDLGGENVIIRKKDVATTTSKGTVQLATSADDTGTTSVLIAAQVKSLLAGKANNTDVTALIGRVQTLETNAGSYATNEALQGVVEGCNAAISGKADASALQALEARVAALEGA